MRTPEAWLRATVGTGLRQITEDQPMWQTTEWVQSGKNSFKINKF